ncbi:MAG: EAL domain-containing protein [Gammaproteobacteria bacterium]|nr:EAL domain-containing protein [Gammaproteobacteria bacterium]
MDKVNANVIQLHATSHPRRRVRLSSVWPVTSADIVTLNVEQTRKPGDPIIAAEPDQHAGLMKHLWDAIQDQQVVVHYQPQFDLATGQIAAMEALVRISGPSGNLLYPDSFIKAAEECGLIVNLGRAIARQACQDFAGWRKSGFSVERIAINLSANQLNLDHFFFEFMQSTLSETGLTFQDIEFELTERQFLESDGSGTNTLRALSNAGSRLALDDFGTGYSSLSYLTTLDIDTIKLDREMVRRLPNHDTTSCIVSHLLVLAEDLGLQVVAEGVETKDQKNFLTEAGCHLAQGFFLALPLPRDQVQSLLTWH